MNLNNIKILLQDISEFEILEIINDALWAPTPDNIQAWAFEVFDKGFNVCIDASSPPLHFDQHYHASLISLGAFITYVKRRS